MRLRRETGDFSIKLTINEETGKYNDIQIPKGLTPEDLIGMIVTIEKKVATYVIIYASGEILQTDDGVGGRWYWIVGASDAENVYLYYNAETGILSGNNLWGGGESVTS